MDKSLELEENPLPQMLGFHNDNKVLLVICEW